MRSQGSRHSCSDGSRSSRGSQDIFDVLLGIIVEEIPSDLSDRYPTCPPTSCWTHSVKPDKRGYRGIRVLRRYCRLHRVVYKHFRGLISSGLVLDHLCRNRGCCNPDHLEPITVKENTLRGVSPPARCIASGFCKYGHPFSGANLWVRANGMRGCAACRIRRRKAWHEANRLKKAIVTP